MKTSREDKDFLIDEGRNISGLFAMVIGIFVFLYALTPRLSPPADPYDSSIHPLLIIVPAASVTLGLIGLRSRLQVCRCGALVGVVLPAALILVAFFENGRAILNYWVR